jgi:hypothetical protein
MIDTEHFYLNNYMGRILDVPDVISIKHLQEYERGGGSVRLCACVCVISSSYILHILKFCHYCLAESVFLPFFSYFAVFFYAFLIYLSVLITRYFVRSVNYPNQKLIHCYLSSEKVNMKKYPVSSNFLVLLVLKCHPFSLIFSVCAVAYIVSLYIIILSVCVVYSCDEHCISC